MCEERRWDWLGVGCSGRLTHTRYAFHRGGLYVHFPSVCMQSSTSVQRTTLKWCYFAFTQKRTSLILSKSILDPFDSYRLPKYSLMTLTAVILANTIDVDMIDAVLKPRFIIVVNFSF